MKTVKIMPTSTLLCVLVVGCAAIAATAPALLPLAYAIALCAALWVPVIFLLVRQPRILLAIAVILFLLSGTDMARSSPQFAIGMRLLALGFCLCSYFRATRSPRSSPTMILSTVLLLGLFTYLWTVSISGLTGPWLFGMGGFVLTGATLLLVGYRVDAKSIGVAVDWALIIAFATSFVLALAGAPSTVAGGRLEGLFANANTLGFMASLSLARFVVTYPRTLRSKLLLLLSAPAALLAGSRSPVGALVIALLIAALQALFSQDFRGRRILFNSLLGGLIAAVLTTQWMSPGTALLRTSNTRDEGILQATQAVQASGGLGVGYQQTTAEIASTPFRWLAWGGYPALILILLSYTFAAILARRHSWRTLFVVMFGIVHSLFEGWYLVGGSTLFFVYWLVVSGTCSDALSPRTDRAAITTEHTFTTQHTLEKRNTLYESQTPW